MATAGPNAPGTLADDAAVGTVAWVDPGNAAVSDNTYATSAIGASAQTHYLKATNFGFAIPTNSSILGVTAAFEYKCTGGFTTDAIIRLVVGGTVSGDDKSLGATWPTSDSVLTFGGAAVLWGLALTAAQVNASDFGVVLAAAADPVDTASVDLVTLTITYVLRSFVASPYSVGRRLSSARF